MCVCVCKTLYALKKGYHLTFKKIVDFREREGERETERHREREVTFLLHLFMHFIG